MTIARPNKIFFFHKSFFYSCEKLCTAPMDDTSLFVKYRAAAFFQGVDNPHVRLISTSYAGFQNYTVDLVVFSDRENR